MSVWLAAYDISDDNRRERIARILLKFGHRVQDSVYILHLEPDDLPQLRINIGADLAPTDLFDLYPIDQRGTRTQWRWQRPIDDYSPVLIFD
ncbi:MAG: CRISPR-associated endonuclease Cas2 [Planctomycetaceae bacterium]|nr:CRISPR-associated endonuclease Cas2 [Planctomycetaceae bacterium]